MAVFSLQEVKKLQVQNVIDDNFASWPESASYGYFGAGKTPINVSTISKLDFSNETVSNPGNKLPSNRAALAATSSSFYGYYGGGYLPTASFIDTISKLDFSNETASNPGNNLPTIRGYLAATSSSSYGYFGGGFSPAAPGIIDTISKLDFSNETVSNPGNNLPTTRGYLATTSTNSYGYFGGGYQPPYICTISRLDFINETVSNPGNNLPASRGMLAAASSSSYGYYGGGQSSPSTYFSTISRLDFINETVSNPGNNLPTVRARFAATSSNSYGYFGGGLSPESSPAAIDTITRLDFIDETVSNPGNNLPTTLYYYAAVSGGSSILRGNGYGTYGYTIGGFGPPSLCNITRQDFSTNTFSDVGTLPTSLYGNDRSAYNNEYGYFGGGYSPSPPPAARRSSIYRFDFSNESTLTLTNSLPQVADKISHTSTREVGYFGGGYSYRFSPPVPATWHSKICKLDFSSESVSTLPSSGRLSAQKGDATAVRTPDYAFFAGGYNLVGPAIYSSVDKLDFSTDVTSSYGNMTRVRYQGTSIENNIYGYFWGGYGPGAQPNFFYSDFEKLQFSNGTFTNFPNSINPLYVYNEHNSQTDSYYGYFVGGHTVPDPSPDGTHVRRLDFSSDTTSLISPPYTPRKVRKAASMSNKY